MSDPISSMYFHNMSCDLLNKILFKPIGLEFGYIALVRMPPCELNISCTSTTAESSKAVVLLLLTFCLLLLSLWESVIVLCFIVRCFTSIIVLQSS